MTDLSEAFAALRKIMLASAKDLQRVIDTDDHLYLNTRHIQANKKPLFFGAVRITKKAVSYHLMPLYTSPALLAKVPPELKKHMQGKSCFNFSAVDPRVLMQIEVLTEAGLAEYRRAGHV